MRLLITGRQSGPGVERATNKATSLIVSACSFGQGPRQKHGRSKPHLEKDTKGAAPYITCPQSGSRPGVGLFVSLLSTKPSISPPHAQL